MTLTGFGRHEKGDPLLDPLLFESPRPLPSEALGLRDSLTLNETFCKEHFHRGVRAASRARFINAAEAYRFVRCGLIRPASSR